MAVSERPGIVVGTGGHVDHGKTALVRALTGVETDRWEEERRRGLTIDIGFARLDVDPSLEVGVVDVPGHEDFLRNMLAGATGIDVLLLVVAADEGPMPQTREHLAIARLLGIRHGVVALSKSDKVDEEWLELAREATRDLVDEVVGADWPIVPVSAETGERLDGLREALREAASRVDLKRHEDLFRLPIDRAFSIHGTGTVVTGTVWSGAVRTGESLRLLPGGAEARVRGLEVHGETRETVGAGRRCAVALVGVDPGEAGRGRVLVNDDAWTPSRRLGVRLETLPGPGRPIEHGQRVRLYLGTREAMARALTPGRRTLAPGAAAWAALELEAPLVARVRDRAIVRFYSPVTTIGGARIAEIDPPGDWEARTDAWEAILDGPDPASFEALAALRGGRGVSVGEAAIHWGGPPATAEAAARTAGAERIGDRWFSPGAVAAALDEAEAAVRRLQEGDRRAPGVSKESVRSVLADAGSPELIETALERLCTEGRLEERGPLLALPGRGPELTGEEEEARDRLESAIAEGGLQPPVVSELGRALRLERAVLDDLLRLLREEGSARPVTPELYVGAEALDEMIDRVRSLLAGGGPAAPTVFKEAFGLSRKYLIPLLEYLDREGVTRRTGEGRVLVGEARGAAADA